MNVTEIEKQTRATKDKIAELDKKLEELPEIKDNLIAQYKIEKEQQLTINKHIDHVKDRTEENKNLYNAFLTDNCINNINVKNSKDIVPSQREYMNSVNMVPVTRKR
ncbi:hypothetical protein EMIT036CA2_40328 [Chryseobacterium sp. IT-36CA2]